MFPYFTKAHNSSATASGFKWETEAFGIKALATDDLKDKLPWVATVIAELLDQNNDGCRDDPNVEETMRISLEKFQLTNFFISVGKTASSRSGVSKIINHEFDTNMTPNPLSLEN